MKANNYNEDSIQILSDLDHIRKNSGMYIGDALNPHHLLQENIDNAIDEVINGYSNGFEVHINKTADDSMTYTVVDFGRGIPTGYKEINGKTISILEAITTKSNSGGKFDNKSYLNSSGLHGLGLKCINALSDGLVIKSIHDGKVGILVTVNGEPTEPVTYKDTKEKSGTFVAFTINKNNPYFEDNQVPFDYVVSKLNTYQAFGIKNIRLFLNDEDVTEQYITATSPFDLHKHPMDNGENALVGDVKVKNEKGETFRLSFNYIAGSSTSYKFNGYTNYLYNKDGGGHIMAAQDAIIGAFRLFCTNRNILIPSTMASDYFIGINCIAHCNIMHKSFASQTKDKLTTGTGTTRDYFKELVDKLIVEINNNIFEKNVGITKAIIQRISDYRKERENRKELKGLSQYITINQSEGSTVRRYSAYEKLVECQSKNRDECECILCEGDSAAGGLKRVRDKKTVAVLPLKGKILNVAKSTMTQALKNKEVAGIISTIGTNIFDKCDVNKMRYNEILYAGDADADGSHIVNLIISLFVNYMPDVVKAGKLKLIMSPLYGYKDKNNEWQGVFKFEDLPKDIRDNKKYTRWKGLGEFNDNQVKKFLLDKTQRKTLTVNYPDDLEEFNNIMATSEGKRNLLENMGILK